MSQYFCKAVPDRREFLKLSAGAGWLAAHTLPIFASSNFWNRKPLADWSAEELDQIRTKSPWAKRVGVEFAGGVNRGDGRGSMDRAGSRGTFGGMTGADSNGISVGGGGRGGGGLRGYGESGSEGNLAAGLPSVVVIVCWESAEPVLAVTKMRFPADLDSHYVIGITGLPPRLLIMGLNGRGQETQEPEDPAARQKAVVERLRRAASLSARGREPHTADIVRQSADKQALIFGFSKSGLPLTTADKDVLFVLKLGRMTVKAKFEPKEMTYEGKLAV